MNKEFLLKFGNICIALSTNETGVTLAFTDEDTSTSITCINAVSQDLLYLTRRFNIDVDDLTKWFKENDIEILDLLP